MSVSVFGDGPKGLTAFAEAPRGEGDDFRMREHAGKVAIFTVKGPQQVETKQYGVKTAIAADVVVVNDDGSTQSYDDALIFNAAPVNQLKGSTGERVAAVIEMYGTGQKEYDGTEKMAPKLVAPTAAQVEAASKATA